MGRRELQSRHKAFSISTPVGAGFQNQGVGAFFGGKFDPRCKSVHEGVEPEQSARKRCRREQTRIAALNMGEFVGAHHDNRVAAQTLVERFGNDDDGTRDSIDANAGYACRNTQFRNAC
jgi:hypothetical protein